MKRLLTNPKWGGVLLSLAALAFASNVKADDGRWHGCDVNTLTQSTIDEKTGYVQTWGEKFYLYNVGTGKFVTCDGNWGEVAVLKYNDFGSAMTVTWSSATPSEYTTTLADGTKAPNLIYSGIDGRKQDRDKTGYRPVCFGTNIPDATTTYGWSDITKNNVTVGPYFYAGQEEPLSGGDWYRRYFIFERVEDASNTSKYTYYIKEYIDYGNGKSGGDNWHHYHLHLGAKRGHSITEKSNNDTQFTDDDRVTFALTSNETTPAPYVKADGGNENFQWRFVKASEIDEVLRAENGDNYDGDDANASYTVSDPFMDFRRSSEFQKNWHVVSNSTTSTADNGKSEPRDGNKDFKNCFYNTFRFNWNASRIEDYSSTADYTNAASKRYVLTYADSLNKYTNGYDNDHQRVRQGFVEEAPWDEAVLRKIQFHEPEDGQYSFAMLDGIGCAEQQITVPLQGYYRIELRGISYSELNHKAQLYAETAGGRQEVDFPVVSSLASTPKVTDFTEDKKTYLYRWYSPGTKNGQVFDQWGDSDDDSYPHYYAIREDLRTGNGWNLRSIGKKLYDNDLGNFTISVIVYVDKDKGTVKFGVQKDEASQSAAVTKKWVHKNTTGTSSGLSSWTIENLKDKEIDYLREDSYYYDTDIVAFDNVQVYYMGKNMFVLDETKNDDEYIENAITYETVVASDGQTKFKNTNVPTYLKRSFSLKKWNSLVLPMNLTAKQVKQLFGSNVKLAKLKDVGTAKDAEGNQHKHCINFETVDLNSTAAATKAIEAGAMYIVYPTADGNTVTTTDGTGKYYVVGRYNWSQLGSLATPQTPYTSGNDALQVQYQGTYKQLDAKNGPQAGAFVFSGGDMYRLVNKKAIKGFRGWLTAKTKNGEDAKEVTFGLDYTMDESTTYIDGIEVDPSEMATDNNVYNINGQLVRQNAQSLEGLPKGFYIMNGKKYFVK